MRDKYAGERFWARQHGFENPPEEFLAAVRRRNRWALAIIVPLPIAFTITWFGHHVFWCAVVSAMLVGVFLGLYIAGKA